MKTLFLSFALSTMLTSVAAADALDDVETRVKTVAADGKVPVVIFDIDDTLMSTDRRKYLALLEASDDAGLRQKYPAETSAIKNLTSDQVRGIYSPCKAVEKTGIKTPEFCPEFTPIWLKIFLSEKYLVDDEPISNAAAYTRRLTKAGATIVYLSGRDEPNLGAGTRSTDFPHIRDAISRHAVSVRSGISMRAS